MTPNSMMLTSMALVLYFDDRQIMRCKIRARAKYYKGGVGIVREGIKHVIQTPPNSIFTLFDVKIRLERRTKLFGF